MESLNDHAISTTTIVSHSTVVVQDSLSLSYDDTHAIGDLERQKTELDTANRTNPPSRRVSRVDALSRRSQPQFTHPLIWQKTSEEQIVDFDGPDDSYRPSNWPTRKKVITTLLYGLTTMGATWSSAVLAPATNAIAREFGVGTEVSVLSTSFLLLGFAVGPMLWAPLSEVYGRKLVVLGTYFIGAIFTFGTATGKDLRTVLITRFFSGTFAAAAVTNTGGVLADIWTPEKRGTAIAGYAFAVVGGPTCGPIVGGAIVSSYLGWRWNEYVTGIMMMSIFILDFLIIDESYPPTLLVGKARRLRFESGNWALHARHEEWNVTVKEMVDKYLTRAFRILFTPICLLMSVYAAFVYGMLFLCLLAIPIQFQEDRGWGPVTGELPFLGIALGAISGLFANIMNNRFYMRRFIANGNKSVPEARLPPMMIGSVFFASGLFVFGWTSSRDIFWLAPIIGLFMLGFSFLTIHQSIINYIIDVFQKYSASAVAANSFLRSVFAAVFPLFATPLFDNLGINWASSLLGFVGIAMIPIPWLFYLYGPSIRKRGKYTKQFVD